MPAAIVTGHLDLERGTWFPEHVHEWHQLVWAAHGVVACRSGGRTWVLPSQIALWVPGGVPHATGAALAADLLGVYVDPARCPVRWSEPTVVRVGALHRELLIHLAHAEPGDAERARAEAVLFDLLDPVAIADVDVPDLTDPRAADVADALTADPSDPRTLEQWGGAVGSSARTLARVWVADTGMPFGVWRTRLRIRAALTPLAAGRPVSTVSRLVGYETPSAFVAAFRREVGVTPGAYFGG